MMPQIPQWHNNFQPATDAIWKVPVEWLLNHVTQCDQKGVEYIGIAVKDGQLYIEGYQSDKKATTPTRPWAEEFDPWPNYPTQG
jgi:hypothetical protein